MASESAIHEAVNRYLNAGWSFEEFEDWLVRQVASPDYLQSSKGARDLISEVRLSMFEHIDGHIDEAQRRDELGSLVQGPQSTVTVQPIAAPSASDQASEYQPTTELAGAAHMLSPGVSVLARGPLPAPRTNVGQVPSLQWTG